MDCLYRDWGQGLAATLVQRVTLQRSEAAESVSDHRKRLRYGHACQSVLLSAVDARLTAPPRCSLQDRAESERIRL